MTSLPTVVVIDDAAEIRTLVRTRLRLSNRLDVVAEGSSGRDALALAEKHRPELLLLDVSMPGMDGLEALPLVHERSPETRVVMYSGFDEGGLAERTLELGAAAFLEKATSLDTLVDDLLNVLGDAQDHRPPRETGQIEPVLEEHLERFRELFEDAAIGMATLTLSGRVVRANSSLAALLGCLEPQLVSAAYAQFVVDDDGLVDKALDQVVRQGRDAVRLEHAVPGRDGRRVLATLSPVRDSSNRPLYLFLQLQDLSAQRTVEEELRQSEARLRMLVDAVEDYAIFMLDPEGRIASWNTGAERIKGWTAEEVIGQHFRVFYPERQQQIRHPEHELEVALRTGSYREEGVRVRNDGSTFWANVTITAVFDRDGRHIGFGKVTRDVTEQRAAAEALRQSEQRFRLLVETVQDYAIFMLDPQGYITSWNAGAQRSQGYRADEIIGQHFRVFYPASKQAEGHPEWELETALRDGRYQEEGWRVRKDGSTYWANVTITAVHDDEGRHLGFAKVTRDVTEQRDAAEALRQSEQRFRLLVEAVQDYAIFMLDPQGHVTSWNAGAQRSQGYRADEIIGQHFRVFYPASKQADGHPEWELETALREGRYEEEGWRVRKDGSTYWANVTITAVHDADGTLVGFAKVTRDITERLLIQNEQARAAQALAEANTSLESANEHLQRLAEDQSHFLAVAAHELRSPVGVLSGTADMLGAHWDQLTADERVELLAGMKPSADRLRRLLGDLLTTSRIQAGALDLDIRELDVREQLQEIVTTLRHAGHDQIVVEADPGLKVAADPGRMAQMVENLVGNALRHGTPPVVLSTEAGPETVDVVVRDAGDGVPDELQERLFERFVTSGRGGTGLGLFIVRELARIQGGEASYRPADGAFVVTLPSASLGSR